MARQQLLADPRVPNADVRSETKTSEKPQALLDTPPKPASATPVPAKRGNLYGGAATDAALSSSRRVLGAARGNRNAFIGLQQYFTPPDAAELVARVIGAVPVLDLTAGSGSLLAGFAEENRYGIEIDADHIDGSYKAIHGDVQRVVPMMRAAGLRWPAVAINPPFGLDWRDTTKSKGHINSTIAAYLWSLDLLARFGQGAMICGTDRLAAAVLSREEGRGIYAVVDVEGPLFDGVALPSSIAFYIQPENRYGETGILRLRSTLKELPEVAAEVAGARRSSSFRTIPYATDPDSLRKGFAAVGREHARRQKLADEKAAARRFDLTIKGSKVSVGLSAYAKLALANAHGSSAVRQVELLFGQHTAYFGQNPRTIKQLRELRDGGILTLDPALDAAADTALADAERVSTPLFPVKPQMRLGWLTDLDVIRCKKSDPERGFAAGNEYELSTRSKVAESSEQRVVETRNGEPELRQFTTERKLLEVRIGKHQEGHRFDEGPENISYLIDHFDIPDPGCVATRFPEEVAGYRRLLQEIAAEYGFKLKEFQLDHLSRLLTKRRGVLAHEQGLGKSLMQMCLAEATVRLGAKDQVLFIAPQDLLPQWSRQVEKFFGKKRPSAEEAREDLIHHYKDDARRYFGRALEEIRTPQKAREVARRLKAGEEGWFITYYEALSVVGRKKTVLDEQPLDHRTALRGRLLDYKRSKGSPATVPEVLVVDNEATTRDACPECRADTAAMDGEAPGWNGEVCNRCGYVHRSLYVKSSYSHLTTAFKRGVKCIDELSEIRGDDSLRSKAIRGMARGPYVYGATGTPLSNFISDAFWGLWTCLGNASAAFPYDYAGGKVRFESDFAVVEHMMGRRRDGEQNQRKRRKVLPQVTNVSQFWRLAQPSISRCRKEQTGEPLVERTYYPIRLPMGTSQKKAHDFWLAKFTSYFSWKFPSHPMVENGLVEKWAAALGQLWRLALPINGL